MKDRMLRSEASCLRVQASGRPSRNDLREPARRSLAHALGGVLLFDIVAKEAPRRRCACEAAPGLRRNAAVLEGPRSELDDQPAILVVVSGGAQVAARQALHFHRCIPRQARFAWRGTARIKTSSAASCEGASCRSCR